MTEKTNENINNVLFIFIYNNPWTAVILWHHDVSLAIEMSHTPLTISFVDAMKLI